MKYNLPTNKDRAVITKEMSGFNKTQLGLKILSFFCFFILSLLVVLSIHQQYRKKGFEDGENILEIEILEYD